MVLSKDVGLFREDARLRGNRLSAAERERLLKPYLPSPESASRNYTNTGQRRKASAKPKPKKSIRAFVRSQIHYLVYLLIHLCLGFYIRISQTIAAVTDRILAVTYYYHHRSPELIARDVKALNRLPKHLSVLLTLRKTEEDALYTLMDEAAELAAWSTCAGIPVLSVYEKTGTLKSHIPTLHKAISDKLSLYYGSPSNQPYLRIFAPHHSAYCPSNLYGSQMTASTERASLTVLLLSYSDGRETIVDLTKTLTEMSQNGKLSPNDISTKLIDAEISDITSHPSSSFSSSSSSSSPPRLAKEKEIEAEVEAKVNMLPSSLFHPAKPEPDLLIIFGLYVKLDGYPPWQIRLTEIFCTGDKTSSIAGGSDEETVEYQGFLRGLSRYARASFRFGR